MPFDLASLPYGPLIRFKKLATYYELGNLNRIGLQHPITETLLKYTTLEYASFVFIGPQHIRLEYFLDFLNREYLEYTFTKGSHHAVFLTTKELSFPPNDEAVDPAIVSQISLQPQTVTLKDFKFNKSSFIFLHSCRRMVTKLILKVSDEYTFTGGEFDLIFETFPVLEELIIKENGILSDWFDDFINSKFENKPKLLVQFQGTSFLTIEECRTKLAKLFEKSGSMLTLSLKLRRNPAKAASFIDKLQRLGYCITVKWQTDEPYCPTAYVTIRKEYLQSYPRNTHRPIFVSPMRTNNVKIGHFRIKYTSPTVFLDDVEPPHVEIMSQEEILDDIVSCMPSEDIALETNGSNDKLYPHLTLTKTKKKTFDQRTIILKNVYFKPEILGIEKCNIDNNVLEFTRPFCHHVKALTLRNIRLPEDISVIPLFETFPNIEELHVSKLKYAFYFTELFKLKSINIFWCDTTSFWKFLRDNTRKVKELFEKAHPSFCLRLTKIGYPLDAMDKIRRLGFHVKLCNYNIYVYNSIQEHIRIQFDKRLILDLYPDKIEFNSKKITASSPKVEFVVDCITLNTDQPSFKVKSKVRSKLIIQPTIVKVTKCVDDEFFKFAKGFFNSLQHFDLRQCCCKKSHSEMLKERIRNTFPNLVKIWDRGDA